jgi:hypothetical protein
LVPSSYDPAVTGFFGRDLALALRRPGGCENGAIVEPIRHRRTKGAETDMVGT